jgi:hypothetical protein
LLQEWWIWREDTSGSVSEVVRVEEPGVGGHRHGGIGEVAEVGRRRSFWEEALPGVRYWLPPKVRGEEAQTRRLCVRKG